MTPSLRPALIACALMLLAAPLRPAATQEPDDPATTEESPQVSMEELSAAPPTGPPTIQAVRLDRPPSGGKGRLTLELAGNRRWCTFPDDRVVPPTQPDRPKRPGESPSSRDKVFTFGYQFTVAAIERSRPGEALLLFESPVFRTAYMRPAGKLGRGAPKPPTGPTVGLRPDNVDRPQGQETASTPVPFWQEQYRCTTVPEAFDFDLEPGTYDVYMAFDILLKSGSWTHRSIGFATDIPVRDAEVTRVGGKVEMLAGGRRTVDLLGVASPAEPRAAQAP